MLVYAMDTRKLPASRIHEARDLLKKYDMLAWKRLDARAEGEYLIHGELINKDGLWKAVPLENMITAGFWKAFPETRNPYRQHLLQQRVKQLRFRYFHNITYSMEDYFLTILSELAECFGPEWKGAMMIAFVAIRARDLTPKNITALLDKIGTAALPQLPWSEDPSLRRLKFACKGMPEAQQSMQLVRLIDERQLVSESQQQ